MNLRGMKRVPGRVHFWGKDYPPFVRNPAFAYWKQLSPRLRKHMKKTLHRIMRRHKMEEVE